jgi:hypothetical protein
MKMVDIDSLSRWRERGGVRVDILTEGFPLTAAMRHPAFLNLYKAGQGFILSPKGRGDIGEHLRNNNMISL